MSYVKLEGIVYGDFINLAEGTYNSMQMQLKCQGFFPSRPEVRIPEGRYNFKFRDSGALVLDHDETGDAIFNMVSNYIKISDLGLVDGKNLEIVIKVKKS